MNPEIKTQSVVYPPNWEKKMEQKQLHYLNWMAYTIKNIHYTNNERIDVALNNLSKK